MEKILEKIRDTVVRVLRDFVGLARVRLLHSPKPVGCRTVVGYEWDMRHVIVVILCK